MAANRMPPEMVQAVMKSLDDDGDDESLDACSLVCKAWTHPARIFLFESATVTWPLRPAVFPFVRDLYICLERRRNPSWNKIFSLLVGFHRIISLEIHLMERSLNDIRTPTWVAFGNNFSTVVALCLRHFKCTKVASLAQVICAFPRLRKLDIREVTSSASPGTLSSATTLQLPPLDTLAITTEMFAVDTILTLLLSFPVRPPLRTVRLRQDIPALVALPKFIEAFGNGLESISLFAHHMTRYSSEIALLTRLRSIQFELRRGDRENPNRWITQILSRISSALLEDVSFKLHSSFDKLSEALEWSEIDVILQRPTFSGLKNLCFDQCYFFVTAEEMKGPSVARTTIPHRLPQCAARGILRVEPW